MAITYGFFNSSNHDRVYDADEMNRMFEGIITDGIFNNVGNNFTITTSSEMTILVDSGRSFFNHIWLYNDSKYPLLVDSSDSIMNRIDAVIIEIDTTISGREGSIKMLQGDPAYSPVKPILKKSNGIYQYALAYITVNAGTTEITEDMIEYVVGNDETPFVTAIPDQMDSSNLTAQWEDSFNLHFEEWSDEKSEEFVTWFSTIVNHLSESQIGAIQAAILAKQDSPTILKTILEVGESEKTLTSPVINNDSLITVYTDPYGVSLKNITQTGNTLYLTFIPTAYTVKIKVLVRN